MQSPSLVALINADADLTGGIGAVSDRFCMDTYEKYKPWLQQLDNNPRPLMDFLATRKSSKLGLYFEDLVAYWLSEKIAEDIFETHIKVSSNRGDIGEFDFLFRAGQKIEQWETAVKFYLYTENRQGEVRWYGPNARDTLDKKLSRMLGHQLRLSEHPEAKDILLTKGINDVYAQMFLKGYLFYPPGLDLKSINRKIAGCEISPRHLTGWWTTLESFSGDMLHSCSQKKLRWRLLPRLDWMAPRIYDAQSCKDLLQTVDQIIEIVKNQISQADRPQLIAGYGLNEAGQWQEESRGFVVNGNWPDAVLSDATWKM